MSDLEIVRLDVHDDEAFDAWHHAYEVAEAASGPDVAAPWQLEEVRALMQREGRRFWDEGWSGLVDGRVVTAGWVRLSLLDNTDRAELAVH
ncbi:PE-PGRS family protein, partial [Nocardioides hankookensis]